MRGLQTERAESPKENSSSQFDAGKVDFKEVFGVLQSVGFNGPIMVEGMKIGVTPEETNGFAKANREFLEKVLREL